MQTQTDLLSFLTRGTVHSFLLICHILPLISGKFSTLLIMSHMHTLPPNSFIIATDTRTHSNYLTFPVSLCMVFSLTTVWSQTISLHFSWNSYSSLNAPCYLCLWVFSHADFCWSNAIIPTLQLYSFPRCQLMYSVIREALMRAQVLSKISEHQTTIIELILIGSIYRCEYGFIL